MLKNLPLPTPLTSSGSLIITSSGSLITYKTDFGPVESIPVPSGDDYFRDKFFITKTNLQPVSQRTINQERVN